MAALIKKKKVTVGEHDSSRMELELATLAFFFFFHKTFPKFENSDLHSNPDLEDLKVMTRLKIF